MFCVCVCLSVCASYQASLEDASSKGEAALAEVSRLTGELKESKKQTRTMEAKVRYSLRYLVLFQPFASNNRVGRANFCRHQFFFSPLIAERSRVERDIT